MKKRAGQVRNGLSNISNRLHKTSLLGQGIAITAYGYVPQEPLQQCLHEFGVVGVKLRFQL